MEIKWCFGIVLGVDKNLQLYYHHKMDLPNLEHSYRASDLHRLDIPFGPGHILAMVDVL
jgi:hypothetical protein